MLIDVYYIIPQGIQPEATTESIAALEINTPGDIAPCFKTATALPVRHQFCLALNITAAITYEMARDIVSFFFFVNYHKQQGIPVIILQAANANDPNAVKAAADLLQQTAKAQGYLQLHVYNLQPATNKADGIYTAGDLSSIQQAYTTLLNNAAAETNALFIKVSQPGELTAVNQALAADEVQFQQQHPLLYALKHQVKNLQQQVQQLEHLLGAAQQEISNQVEHNRILRSSSQAAALQNYYNNEYEVLPLWYKRLGHLIKVFTGKRTLRSLFNDNVKKYKS
jgi:hypothetical protein